MNHLTPGHWANTNRHSAWVGPRPKSTGRVYALSTTEHDELEAIARIDQQRRIADAIRDALELCAATIEQLPESPLVWPARGYDLETTLSVLRRDLMPDRSEAEIVAAAGN